MALESVSCTGNFTSANGSLVDFVQEPDLPVTLSCWTS